MYRNRANMHGELFYFFPPIGAPVNDIADGECPILHGKADIISRKFHAVDVIRLLIVGGSRVLL